MAGMETFKGDILHLSLPSQTSTTFWLANITLYLLYMKVMERDLFCWLLPHLTPKAQNGWQAESPLMSRKQILWTATGTHVSGRSAIFCTSFPENQLTESLKTYQSFTFVFRLAGLLRQQYTGQDLLSRLRVHVRLEGEQGLRLVLWQPERFES